MDEVNKTLYIPLYGKAIVSKQKIILNDPMAEEIWNAEQFPIKGKSKSKWLCYNMAMRAKVFDDWTSSMLNEHKQALVLHIGCGLDSRCLRVNAPERNWIDCDFPAVIFARRRYYKETDYYSMRCFDATNQDDLLSLPDAPCAIVVLEGVSMYLSNEQLRDMFRILKHKYKKILALMDVYTEFGAKASKYKNPINDVGITKLYGVDDIDQLLRTTGCRCVMEHTFTPQYLVNELKLFDKTIFKMLFTGKLYRKIYRLYEVRSE
ncbi:MAG: class I SAM-dependent methyltransferase [Lachnospiraceae bacterium]|nr:class I SAM-dependent methyltransferase [Lachnospiraceae bacterium]